jgi:hypothetical protein
MRNNNNLWCLLCILLAVIAACKKEIHGPLQSGGNTPGVLSKTTVENLPGAAKITYTLPDDADVLYVTAGFEIRPGVQKEEKASLYKNFLLLEGFADTLEHTVTLTVVSKSEKASAPVLVKVKPLLPPYLAVYRSLLVKEDWGGLSIAYTNAAKADVSIMTLTDTAGIFESVDNYYTKLPAGSYAIRGYDSVSRKFGLAVKDKWGNISDTLVKNYKPLYEKKLDKTKFQVVELPTDVKSEDNWGDMSVPRLWDGSIDGWDMFHSKPHDLPMWITFDMGVTAQLSRTTMWQRQDDQSYLFAQNNVKKYELWGSVNPNPDGSWDNSWIKLAESTVTKPSGRPLGDVAQEDIDAGKLGDELSIPLTMPRVRYIRVKIIEAFQPGASAANIAEISLWGQP